MIEYADPRRIDFRIVECKSSTGSIGVITGMATRFYEPHEYKNGVDLFTDHCFDASLRSGDPKYLLINHDQDLPVTSTKRGHLELRTTESGLMFRCAVPDTQTGRFALKMIGLCGGKAGASVGYFVEEMGTRQVRGREIRFLQKCKLVEVSIVKNPAVPGAFAVSEQVHVDTKSAESAAFQSFQWALADLGDALSNIVKEVEC